MAKRNMHCPRCGNLITLAKRESSAACNVCGADLAVVRLGGVERLRIAKRPDPISPGLGEQTSQPLSGYSYAQSEASDPSPSALPAGLEEITSQPLGAYSEAHEERREALKAEADASPTTPRRKREGRRRQNDLLRSTVSGQMSPLAGLAAGLSPALLVPRVAADAPPPSSIEIEPLGARLLTLIDGQTTLDELVEATGHPREDVEEALSDLATQGMLHVSGGNEAVWKSALAGFRVACGGNFVPSEPANEAYEILRDLLVAHLQGMDADTVDAGMEEAMDACLPVATVPRFIRTLRRALRIASVA